MIIDNAGYIRAAAAVASAAIKALQGRQPSHDLEALSEPVLAKLKEIAVVHPQGGLDVATLARLEQVLPQLVYSPDDFAQCSLDCGKYAERLADRLPPLDANFSAAPARAVAVTALRLTFEAVLADPKLAHPLQMATNRILLTSVARSKGVPEEPLRAVLARFGEDHVSFDEIPDRLTRKADELAHLREELARLRNDRPEFATLRAKALRLIDQGDFEEARAELRKGRELARAIRQEHAREEASFLLHEARLDRLNLDYDAATDAYQQATAVDPDNILVWCELGDLWKVLGNLAKALAAFKGAEAACRRQGGERSLSVSYVRIGDVRRAQGDLAGALKSYEASLAIRETLNQRDPHNTEWQRDLSVSHNRIGDVRRAQGDLAGALESYEADLAIAEALSERDPRNAEWQRDLSISHNRIGDVRRAQGDLAGALESYEASLAIRETLSQRDPHNTQWQRDLSISHNRIGDVRRAQGDLAGALKSYAAGLTIAETLSQRDPRNTEWQRDLSISHERIGNVRREQGDLAGALESYEASLAIREVLSQRDPRNTEWQRDLSVTHNKIGDIRKAQGDLTSALENYESTLAIIEKLSRRDSSNTEWQRDLAVTHERIGDLHRRADSPDKARAAFQTALNIYVELIRRNPDDVPSLVNSVFPRRQLAELEPAKARGHLQAALDILKPLAARDRLDAMRRGWIAAIEADLTAPEKPGSDLA